MVTTGDESGREQDAYSYERQVLGAPLIELGMVLRLERALRSMVKLLRQAKNEPPPPLPCSALPLSVPSSNRNNTARCTEWIRQATDEYAPPPPPLLSPHIFKSEQHRSFHRMDEMLEVAAREMRRRREPAYPSGGGTECSGAAAPSEEGAQEGDGGEGGNGADVEGMDDPTAAAMMEQLTLFR